VVRQQFDFSCGSAALATLLTYHLSNPTPERETFAKMWATGDQKTIRKSGFSMLDMKSYLNAAGYRAEGFRLGVNQLSKLKQPGIALVNLKGYKHFVVVKGARGDRILVGDPMLGIGEYSKKDFAKIWNGILLAVVDPKTAPKFNLASEWGPWSTAPLEQAALHVPASSLTDNLPFDYQISSELLLNIRGGN
jgi:predicted double-glycine peptidase